MKRRMLAWLLVLAMCLSILPTAAFAAEAQGGGTAGTVTDAPSLETQKGQGLGTSEANPILISTVEQLADLAVKVNDGVSGYNSACYKLMADIDLSGVTNWTPIGKYATGYQFQGTFDGNGYAIKNLKISTTEDDQGLFGAVQFGTIQNLSVIDCNVEGRKYVGGITGNLYDNGTIKNCTVSGTVKGNNTDGVVQVGGVTGYLNSSSSISNCLVAASVSASGGQVGGVAGLAWGDITNCLVTGDVSSDADELGGVAGNTGMAVNISNCVVLSANISGKVGASYVNRIVGRKYSDPDARLDAFSNNYAFSDMLANEAVVKDGKADNENGANISAAGGVLTKQFKDIFVEADPENSVWHYEEDKIPVLSGEPGSIPAWMNTKNPFTDVNDGDWFYKNVMYVYATGLMNGVTNTSFSPDGTSTRAMVATVLWRLKDSPTPAGTKSFTDVQSDHWFYNAVIWAAEQDITQGYGGGLFGPNDAVTREQFVTFLYRYAGSPTVKTGDLSQFSDADTISSWAKDAIAWAVEAGIIQGRDDGTFDPGNSANRGELAKMLHMFAVYLEG